METLTKDEIQEMVRGMKKATKQMKDDPDLARRYWAGIHVNPISGKELPSPKEQNRRLWEDTATKE